MSDNIPFDIQEEIIKILPIKSLVRFRLVSKQWKSLIDSSKFIACYHTHQKHKQHLLVSYQEVDNFSDDDKYVWIVDDETFPQQKFSSNVPTSVKLLHRPDILTSQGLLFVHGIDRCSGIRKALIWNPTIRKSVNIDLCFAYTRGYEICAYFGFGVCPDTYDPKIVKYRLYRGKREFEIFTLSTNAWRRLSKNLPRECIEFTNDQVTIDRFMYWLVREILEDDGYYEDVEYYDDDVYHYRNLILSFDMTSEEFTEISYPGCPESTDHVSLSSIRDSLAVVQLKYEAEKPVYSVWKMMEHDVLKPFTKLYTINTTDAIQDVYGFRKSGEPIVAMDNDHLKDLFAYDRDSKHINYIGISGNRYACIYVISYIETLLLLDH